MTERPAWWDEDNRRRCTLIHKELRGTIEPVEVGELAYLEKKMDDWLNSRHPLPMPPEVREGSST